MKVVHAIGLTQEGLAKKYPLETNPRLKTLVDTVAPIIFPQDSTLSDPFEGLLETELEQPYHVHSCLGCPLVINGTVVGCITMDVTALGVFDNLPVSFLEALGRICGASLRTLIVWQKLNDDNNRHLEWAKELQKMNGHDEIFGTSPVMTRLKQEIQLVSRTKFPVLILGETGTGKELVARSVHLKSTRSDGPWVTVNCAALPDNLAESELFGHEKGSFTGATKSRTGKFEMAHMGTLFLDEIGDLSLNLQAKLLRALQEGEIQKVGSNTSKKLDVRIIAATHRNLKEMITQNTFREDLWHRLHVFPLSVPPLRDRKDDIRGLSDLFAHECSKELDLPNITLPEELLNDWRQREWSGNVRELKNTIRSTILKLNLPDFGVQLTNVDSIHTNTSPTTFLVDNEKMTLKESVEAFKKHKIQNVLKNHNGVWSAAAEELGVDRANLQRLSKRLGISKTTF